MIFEEYLHRLLVTQWRCSLRFTVSGDPQGKGRPRFTRSGHTYTPAQTRTYERRVRDSAIAELRRRGMTFNPVGAAPVMVAMIARFGLPKSISRKEREARLAGLKAPNKPDTDNISKVKDALNGVLWDDDKQVNIDFIAKEYTVGEPELEVLIKWDPIKDGD